jgi:hypothetical protein
MRLILIIEISWSVIWHGLTTKVASFVAAVLDRKDEELESADSLRPVGSAQHIQAASGQYVPALCQKLPMLVGRFRKGKVSVLTLNLLGLLAVDASAASKVVVALRKLEVDLPRLITLCQSCLCSLAA